MRTLCLAVLCCASAAHVFCQLESDTLTFRSSRTIFVPPDQLVLNVSLSSSPDATLDQVVALLQGSGVTAADLSGLSSSTGNQTGSPVTTWSFTVGVPLTKLKGTVASLTALQASLKKGTDASLTFQPQGGRVSPELMQAQTCSVKDLVANAQMQVQKLASAAGEVAGPILAISDGNNVEASTQGAFANLSVLSPARPVVISPIGIATGFPQSIFVAPPASFTCFAEVKFKLIRLH